MQRRADLKKKLQFYYEAESAKNEPATVSVDNGPTIQTLWEKQYDGTRYFTRDFIPIPWTPRTGLAGKAVVAFKRFFRKGTIYIFEQFSEFLYQFESRLLELLGMFIQFFASLDGRMSRTETQAQEQIEQISRQQERLQELEKEVIKNKKWLVRQLEEHNSLISSQRNQIMEQQEQIDTQHNQILKQAMLMSDIEGQRQRLEEEQSVAIFHLQKQIECQLQSQGKETELLSKRLDEYFSQINTLQSAFLLRPAAGIDNKQMAALYVYRYMLGREPEDMQIVWDNKKNWEELRSEVLKSPEFRMKIAENFGGGHVKVEGITYFFPPNDTVISLSMIENGVNWAKHDIERFISLADRFFYKGDAPEKGIFLDIGGNIGTTSIYCKVKLKQQFKFIAFEPISLCAKLLAANAAFNGVGSDIWVEQVALSDQEREHATMKINRDNWGNCTLVDDVIDSSLEDAESVLTTTLDKYIAENDVKADNIKYIWLDVEGHEYEVLKGALEFFSVYRVPMCMEFNQNIYKEHGHYESTLELLKKNYKSFMVASQIKTGNEAPRSINELSLLWEEEKQKACDLILL